MDDLREVIARAMSLCDAKEQFPDMAEKIVNVTSTIHDEERADAALAAIKEAGFVVVPIEPTEARLDAAWRLTGESREMRARVHHRMARYYRAMIEASNAPT